MLVAPRNNLTMTVLHIDFSIWFLLAPTFNRQNTVKKQLKNNQPFTTTFWRQNTVQIQLQPYFNHTTKYRRLFVVKMTLGAHREGKKRKEKRKERKEPKTWRKRTDIDWTFKSQKEMKGNGIERNLETWRLDGKMWNWKEPGNSNITWKELEFEGTWNS